MSALEIVLLSVSLSPFVIVGLFGLSLFAVVIFGFLSDSAK